jgi:protein SCO1
MQARRHEGTKKRRFSRVILAFIFLASAAQVRAEERHAMRGVVLKVDAAGKTMFVSTEKVAGFMDAMVMPFSVQTAAALKDLKSGATIEFMFVVDGTKSRAENIRVKAYENLEQEPLELRRLQLLTKLAAGPNAVKPLAVDQAVPDFVLTDQHHQQVTFSKLAGKVVAVTFAYLRCPNPAYCFRLASNFGQLQKRFADRVGKDLVLLTIVIDPEHDEKGALAEYARIWTTSPHWHFLTGPVEEIRKVAGRFGVEFWKDEGLLIHSFGTSVIDRHGKLAASLEGNQFSARQLGDLVEAVMQGRTPASSKVKVESAK